jgi:hypothetical protein
MLPHILRGDLQRYSFSKSFLSIGIDKIGKRHNALIVFASGAKSIPPVK